MSLSSKNKDALFALIQETYGVKPNFIEVWQAAGPSESPNPSDQKLQVVMTLPGKQGSKNVIYTAVVWDKSQESVELAYGRFFAAMTKAIKAGRKPFGI